MLVAGGEKMRTACVTGGNGYIAAALVKMLLQRGYAVKATVRNPGELPIACFPVLICSFFCFFLIWPLKQALICELCNKNLCVDDVQKNSHLKELQALGPLEILRADLDEEGSFDEAVAGCDYAFLVAAPVNLTSENPEVNTSALLAASCRSLTTLRARSRVVQKDQIEPSVRGILNVMRSCAKAGTVRRVVLTSAASSVCIRPLEGGGGGGHVLDEESWSDLEWVTAEKPPSWVRAQLPPCS
jgi:anthocyanidin reductase